MFERRLCRASRVPSLLLALALALAVSPTGPASGAAGAAAWPGLELTPGLRGQPHPRPLAAALVVAGAGTDPRLLRESLALMRDAGMSVYRVELDGRDDADLSRISQAWGQVRLLHGTLPLALVGHGQGAVLATVAADALESDRRPQLLWLLAPGGAAQPAANSRLRFPEAALARVDGLCNGRVERVTRVMLTHGAADTQIDPARMRAFADAAPAATLYRVPGAGHHDLLAATDTRQRLQRLLLSWIHESRSARAAWRGAAASG